MQKKITKHFFLYAFFILSVFSLFSQTTFSQSSDITSLFPYKINFTESEVQLLKSLDQATLAKFILIAKNILEKNLQAASSTTATINALQPTVYSNSYSPQTPNYNSQTGQYQSRPVGQENSGSIPGSSGGSSGSNNNNNSGGQSSNPFMPSSSGQSGGQQGNPFLGNGAGSPHLPPSPAAAMAQGMQQGLNQAQQVSQIPFDPASVKGCPPVIPGFCQANFGVDVTGSCSTKVLTSPPIQEKLKKDMMCVCALVGHRISSASVYRTSAQQQCANPSVKDSQHSHGTAIDLSQNGLTSEQKLKAYFYFKSNGYRHGCYGPGGHVHFDFGLKTNYGSGCPAELNTVLKGF